MSTCKPEIEFTGYAELDRRAGRGRNSELGEKHLLWSSSNISRLSREVHMVKRVLAHGPAFKMNNLEQFILYRLRILGQRKQKRIKD